MAKTILVVDDSGTVRQQVSMALKQAGFAIVEAADGQEALAAIESNPAIDMVVCDVNMPVLNGLEMVEKVKNGLAAIAGNSSTRKISSSLYLQMKSVMMSRGISAPLLSAR